MSDFVAVIQELVNVESPSSEHGAVLEAQRVLAQRGGELLSAEPVRHNEATGPLSLGWHLGDPDDPRRVLLLGHIDTVWPIGTVRERPFAVVDNRATGPGVFDMKAGLVVALHALAALGKDAPVSLLVTGDEEVGSGDSRDLIESVVRDCQACLVLEGAGPRGAVKSARKGWSFYTVEFRGVSAHAGLEPEKGINVLPPLAAVIRHLAELNDPDAGVTVTPTMAKAGTTVNTIPELGELIVDVRCSSADQQQIVDRALRELAIDISTDVSIRVRGGVNRPPMPHASSQKLLDRLSAVQSRRGQSPPADVAVGGISDANLTAALGVPTLDGLGAVGAGAHAEHEWVDLQTTRERVPMVAALIQDLIDSPLTEPVLRQSGGAN